MARRLDPARRVRHLDRFKFKVKFKVKVMVKVKVKVTVQEKVKAMVQVMVDFKVSLKLKPKLNHKVELKLKPVREGIGSSSSSSSSRGKEGRPPRPCWTPPRSQQSPAASRRTGTGRGWRAEMVTAAPVGVSTEALAVAPRGMERARTTPLAPSVSEAGVGERRRRVGEASNPGEGFLPGGG